MKRPWTVCKKLCLFCVSVTAMIFALGTIGYYTATTGARTVTELGSVRLPAVQAVQTILEAQTAMDGIEKSLLSTSLDGAARASQVARFDAIEARADRALAAYEALPHTGEELACWQSFRPAWAAW
jgi:hypothetical protein